MEHAVVLKFEGAVQLVDLIRNSTTFGDIEKASKLALKFEKNYKDEYIQQLINTEMRKRLNSLREELNLLKQETQ